MYTAKDLHKDYTLLKSKDMEEKSILVDEWLKSVVLPCKLNSTYEPSLDIPKGISSQQLQLLLEQRGFHVKIESSYQGTYIQVIIPPQGK